MMRWPPTGVVRPPSRLPPRLAIRVWMFIAPRLAKLPVSKGSIDEVLLYEHGEQRAQAERVAPIGQQRRSIGSSVSMLCSARSLALFEGIHQARQPYASRARTAATAAAASG